jgi:hypothetical protein
LERRELLQWMLATAGVQCLDALAPGELLALGHSVHAQPATGGLDPAVREIIAAAERIIPADETPGATDAGVAEFVEKIATDWYSDEERERLLAGLASLDQRSRSTTGTGFATATEVDQGALLLAFDRDVSELRQHDGADASRHWFSMFKYLTVFGYCTSEPGMKELLRSWPPPPAYDGCAP